MLIINRTLVNEQFYLESIQETALGNQGVYYPLSYMNHSPSHLPKVQKLWNKLNAK